MEKSALILHLVNASKLVMKRPCWKGLGDG